MLCQKCGKNVANTHIKTVINGKVTEQSLCGYCAAKQGFSSPAGNSLSKLLASMMGQSLQMGSASSGARCKSCGATFADIAENGKVGCATCYSEFSEQLLPHLKRIHGNIKHTGKIPTERQLVVKPSADTISELKARLASLVVAEEYEEAAVVRDEIKRLEAQQ